MNLTGPKNTFSISEAVGTLVIDREAKTVYTIVFGAIGVMGISLALVFGKLPNTIPMYFSLPWGEARLAPKIWLAGLPILAIIFDIFNLFLARIALRVSPVLAKYLTMTSLVVTFILLFSMWGIIRSLIL